MSDEQFYFAYGSNLDLTRLVERVCHPTRAHAGFVEGWRLEMNKRGRDGSGKANLVRHDEARVWGVVYHFEHEWWHDLDPYEDDYERVMVEVVAADGRRSRAQTYQSLVFTEDPIAYDWYVGHVVGGAREHALPEDWVATLEGLPSRPDPRRR